MHFLRKFGLWFALLVFSSSISLFTFSFIALQTVGRPDTVKGWLADANVYENFLSIAKDEIKLDENQDSTSLIDQQALQTAVETGFTAEQAQIWAESVIDGTYSWLDQKTSEPEFVIDYTSQADDFINSLADSAEAKYLQLPVCKTLAEAREVEADPINASCQVPGVDVSKIRQDLLTEFKDSEGLFNKTTFTQEDIRIKTGSGALSALDSVKSTEPSTSEDSSQSVPYYQKYDSVPARYSSFKKLPYLAVLLAIASVLAALFLASSKKAGARKVGWRLITGSIVSVVGVILLLFGSKALSGVSSEGNAKEVQDLVVPLINQVVTDFIIYSLVVSVVLLVIGLVVIVITRKRDQPQAKVNLEKNSLPPTTS